MCAETPDRDPNDVRALLNLNVTAQKAVEAQLEIPRHSSRRFRRTRDALLALLIVDTLLALIAWRVGPGDPFLFVGALSAMGLFTAWVCWNVWFLNTQ